MKTFYKMAVILLMFTALVGCAAYPAYGYNYGYPPVYKNPYTQTQIGNYAFHPHGPAAGAYERHMDTQYGPCWRYGIRGSHC